MNKNKPKIQIEKVYIATTKLEIQRALFQFLKKTIKKFKNKNLKKKFPPLIKKRDIYCHFFKAMSNQPLLQ